MKTIIVISFFSVMMVLPSCDTLKQLTSEPTTAEISQALKQALEFGISEGADKLALRDGYFKSEYKIYLPAEAREVTDKLKFIPGFFDDAFNILMGKQDAATQYLRFKTYNPLYDEFHPVIVNSLNKFNAIEYWAQ